MWLIFISHLICEGILSRIDGDRFVAWDGMTIQLLILYMIGNCSHTAGRAQSGGNKTGQNPLFTQPGHVSGELLSSRA